MKKFDNIEKVYSVNYIEKRRKTDISFYKTVRFTSEDAAFSFIMLNIKNIVQFRIDIQNCINILGENFKSDKVYGPTHYIVDEIWTRQNIDDIKDDFDKAVILSMINENGNDAIVKDKFDEYKGVVKGDIVLDKNFNQIYPVMSELKTKSK